MFDRVVIVDWSARSSPSPERASPDAIWVGEAGAGETYHRTRALAEADLARRIAGRPAGQRMLIGFDFPFAYPAGFAAMLGCDGPLAVWDWMAERIEDGPDNANNRFETAAGINGIAPGAGPFWGLPHGRKLADLPPTDAWKTSRRFCRKRRCEPQGAQETWKLFGNGSVGSQALLGLPVLSRLRRLPGVTVWPFEPMGPVVLAEVWPSLLAARVAGEQGAEIRDRVQVRVLARELARLARAGRLAPLFDVPEVAREEGWILGVGHEAALRCAKGPQAGVHPDFAARRRGRPRPTGRGG